MGASRGSMHKARKVRIWNRVGGICWICNNPVACEGPEVIYDHRIALEVSLDDSDANIFPVHRKGCNEQKTYREDMGYIAKTRRMSKKFGVDHDPDAEKKPSRIQSRGFYNGPMKRTFSGKVVPR